MNYSDSGTITLPGKKNRFSFAARALVVGLVLGLPGAAALAIGEPIPGIDIVVKCLGCTPPYHGIPAPTGANGAYQFTGLAPGKYDLSVAGQRIQTISVGVNRSINGVLSRDGAKTSITFNGQIGVVPDGLTRQAKEGGSALGAVSTTRETAPRPDGGDKKAGISDQGAAGGLISYGTAPPPKDGKLPGITGTPIQGIPIGLEGEPGRIKVSTTTNTNGDEVKSGRADYGTRLKTRVNNVPAGTQDRATGVRVATGDVNGDGRAELRTAPPKADETEKSRFKIADNENPRPADRGNQKLPGKVAATVTVTPVNDPPSRK